MFKITGWTVFGSLRCAVKSTEDEARAMAQEWIDLESIKNIKINAIGVVLMMFIG